MQEWRGLVWVNVSLDVPFDLGSFAAECEGFDIESFRLAGETSHVLRCNWKTYADNYGASEEGNYLRLTVLLSVSWGSKQEQPEVVASFAWGYHIPFIHPELNRQLDMRTYRVDAHDRWTRHSATMRDGSPAAGVWLWRFPNLALNVYADGMNVERFTPVDATTTRIDYTYFFRDGVGDDDAIKLSQELLAEDGAICEAVQRNLEAGIYDTGVLSPRHEGGLVLLQRLVREALSALER